jgi:quinoprotein glucose dehydrogenase
VNANDIAWIASLGENKGGTTVEQLYLTNCAGCHRDDMMGTPPQIPPLVDLRGKRRAEDIATVIRQGAGRMPSFPNLSRLDGALIGEYVLTGVTPRA